MRPPKYEPDELWKKCLEYQNENPMASESELCVYLGVASNYFCIKARNDPDFKDLKQALFAIREAGWIKFGREGFRQRGFNNLLYIWMTKQILRWRENTGDDEEDVSSPDLKPITSPEEALEMVNKVRKAMRNGG